MNRGFFILIAGYFASVFHPHLAQADLLFLDTDDAPAEVNAAQSAAQLRHENLIVLPARDADQSKTLLLFRKYEEQKKNFLQVADEYARQFYQVQREIEYPHHVLTANQISTLSARMDTFAKKRSVETAKVQLQLNAIETAESHLQNLPQISIAEIQMNLAQIENQGKSISAILFSGHHDSNEYSGVLGSISKQEVIDAFKAHPALLTAVKAVYGWGCYSATAAQNEWWRQSFPSLEILFGFEGTAPAAGREEDVNLLTSALVHESSIRRVSENPRTMHSVKLLSHLIHSLKDFDQTLAGVWTHFVFVGMVEGSFDASKSTALCTQKNLDLLATKGKRVDALFGVSIYGNTDGELQNFQDEIPCDGQNSWLRDYYNKIKSLQHCTLDLKLGDRYQNYADSADQLIDLIDFKQIFENFKNYYHDDISSALSLIQVCGVTAPDFHQEIACSNSRTSTVGLSRAQGVAFANTLADNQCIQDLAEKNKSLENFVREMQVTYLNLECIPLAWVNPPAPGQAIQAPPVNCLLSF